MLEGKRRRGTVERDGGARTVRLLQDAIDGAGAAAAGHGDVEVVVVGGGVGRCHCLCFYRFCVRG